MMHRANINYIGSILYLEFGLTRTPNKIVTD